MASPEANRKGVFENIFQQEIYTRFFSDLKKPSKSQSRVIFIGGQPGAGKSVRERFITAELNSYEPNTTVEINGDDFRAFHPDYYRLLTEDDSSAAAKIDRDNQFFIESSIDAAARIGSNVVLEGTFRQPKVVQTTAEHFATNGYASEAVLLVVHPILSRIGIMRRYFEQKAILPFARYTELSAHNAALAGIDSTIQTIIEYASMNEIRLVTRGGDVLMDECLCDRRRSDLERIAKTAHSILDEHRNDLSNQEITFAKYEMGIIDVMANKLQIPPSIVDDIDDLRSQIGNL